MIKLVSRVPGLCSHCTCLHGTVVSLTRNASAKAVRKVRVINRSESNKAKHFVDFRRCRVIAGSGGDGSVSFLSLPRKEWAGPDGGNGGNGGHVIFKADSNVKSLEHLPPTIQGNNGVDGKGKCCHGKSASHTEIMVPIGTVFRDDERIVLADLKNQDDMFVGARGGAGGNGNHFYLSNENRAPAYAENGAQGEDKRLCIELRIMAHAGLVGFPNAGKSTLLRAISRAKPKVAAYPFTTLNPHVGIVEYDDHTQVAVADIPGLISGAHKNRGLGISFLRHIERCVCLLYVLDLSVDQPWTQLSELQYELEQYQEGLSTRPYAIIGNKMDLPNAKENLKLLREKINLPIMPLSGKKLINMDELVDYLKDMYDKYVENGS